MATIAHLSDIHFGRVDPRIVDPLVATTAALKPDLLVMSGDLTQRARRRQFRDARHCLDRLPQPQLVIPGNHDVPLWDVALRFADPYGRYQHYIQHDLDPVFECEEFIAVGLNSARNFPFHGGGRVSQKQVDRAAAVLREAPAGRIKIVVTHHPFYLPSDAHARKHRLGGAEMAMVRLANAGADLFLAGHLHVHDVAHAAERFKIAGHSALLIQAGTLSTRHRGETNSFNVVTLSEGTIGEERYDWNVSDATFQAAWSKVFSRRNNGWF
jgi:3',5'-cyclic AMP phosphodiesterase CpdA